PRRVGPMVRDDAELEPTAAQRLEQRMRRAEQRDPRLPRRVLGGEERAQAVLVETELVAQQRLVVGAAHEARQELVAEPLRERGGLVAPPDGVEPGAMPGCEQLVVPLEAHERLAPVEGDRLDHRPTTLLAWRGGSCGRRSCWCPLRSLRATGCTPTPPPCSCLRPRR